MDGPLKEAWLLQRLPRLRQPTFLGGVGTIYDEVFNHFISLVASDDLKTIMACQTGFCYWRLNSKGSIPQRSLIDAP